MKRVLALFPLIIPLMETVSRAESHLPVAVGEAVMGQFSRETLGERDTKTREQVIEWVKENEKTLSQYSNLDDKQKDLVSAELFLKLSIVSSRSDHPRLRFQNNSVFMNEHLLLAVETYRKPDDIRNWIIVSTKTGKYEIVSKDSFKLDMTDRTPALVTMIAGQPKDLIYGLSRYKITGQSSPPSKGTYLFLQDRDGARFRSERVGNLFTPPSPVN